MTTKKGEEIFDQRRAAFPVWFDFQKKGAGSPPGGQPPRLSNRKKKKRKALKKTS